MAARAELIAIQQRLVEELKESIYDTVGRDNDEIDQYYDEYRREFRSGYERAASRDEIIQRLMRAELAYFGDYHTLRSSQTAQLDLLEECARRGRRIILCTEMAHSSDQQHITDYLRGEIDDEAFLWRVKWDTKWGFPWKSWSRYFLLARRHNLPIFGINLQAEGDDALHVRDRYGARLVSALTQLYPDHLVATVYGDLHMAPTHLPGQVDKELSEWGVKRRSVFIYQNSETLYWKLVEQHLEHVVDYLKLRRDAYVLMNATPLVKFQSFANWQHRRHISLAHDEDELEFIGDTGLAEQVVGYIRTIGDFLGIELEERDNFELYTAADLDLLENLVKRGIYTAAEMQALKSYIEMAESAFFERARVLYIGNFTVANAAEAAGRYILSAMRPVSKEPVAARDEFYARCMVEALAYFCSKIIDPGRAARDEDDWRQVLQRYGRRRKLGRIQRLDVLTARLFVKHKEYERRVLESGSYAGPPGKLFELETDEHVALTRALGRALGERMFAALGEELVSREQIAQAMQDPIREQDVSRNRYFDLLRALAGQTRPTSTRHKRLRSFDE